MLTAAQESQARARTVPITPRTPRKGQPEIAAAVPVSEPAPVGQESHPAEPVAQVSTLRVTFDSALGGASVMVYVGNDKVLQESVGDRGGILRKGKGGDLDRSFPLAPGQAKLRVYITPPGQASVTKAYSGNFPAGQSRHLEIHLFSDAQVTAVLH